MGRPSFLFYPLFSPRGKISLLLPSHIAPVLAAHGIERAGDLAQGAMFDGFHQRGKGVFALAGRVGQPGQGGLAFRLVDALEAL